MVAQPTDLGLAPPNLNLPCSALYQAESEDSNKIFMDCHRRYIFSQCQCLATVNGPLIH